MTDRNQTTLTRALVLLDHCARATDGLSFSDLQAACGGIAGTQLSRILTPLLEGGNLEKCPISGRYRCGPTMRSLARAMLGQATLEERLQPLLDQLAQETQHSAAYFHWDGEGIYVRVKAELSENFHYAHIGYRRHSFSHTFYRAILAWLEPADHQRVGAPVDKSLMARIREDRHYLQIEESGFKFLRITAPVFYGTEGPVSGSLGITSLIVDLKKDLLNSLTEAVCDCARKATERLTDMESRACVNPISS